MLGSLCARLTALDAIAGSVISSADDRQHDADLAVGGVADDKLDRGAIGRSLEVDQSLNLDFVCHRAPFPFGHVAHRRGTDTPLLRSKLQPL